MQQEFIWGLNGLSRDGAACASLVGSVVTIGSFDGVHRGHQQILERVVARARRDGLASAAIIFEPQPHEYFAKSPLRPRLMRLREKVSALFSAGIDKVVCLRFNRSLRELTADAFVKQVLQQGLHVQHLEVGDDFRFGCDRSGDFALLQRIGQRDGFSVANSATYLYQNERVSSTRIREILQANDLVHAQALLGRPYAIAGRVIYGRQLGRTINVPTANVGLGRYPAAVSGVYAVMVRIGHDQDSATYRGVANVGVKPTITGDEKPLLEVHLFDFSDDLYGRHIHVEFLKFIRPEKKFSSFNELTQQIQMDCEEAKIFLAALN